MSEMEGIEMKESFCIPTCTSSCEKGFYYEKISHDSVVNNLIEMREGRLA